MATWPVTLPLEPIIDSITETPPNLTIRTEMDAGPAKVRRRYTVGVRLFEVSYVFSPAEMSIWENFYENTIMDGILSFTYPHPRRWGLSIVVRLVEPPKYKSKGGGYYEIDMQLEMLPGTTVTGSSVYPSTSLSISPSMSPPNSVSPSISRSASPSRSPSVSVSPSASLSPSKSPSISPSISPSLSPST